MITSPQIQARIFPQESQEEISQRVDTFASLKGYGFNENKALVMEGLLQKKEKYGDFYCIRRFDNVPENVCPCLETRLDRYVKREAASEASFTCRGKVLSL